MLSTNILNSLKPGDLSAHIIKRWRKPIYAPIAPSKLFRVVERNKQSTEEYQYLKKQYANYRSQMRSLKSYLATNLEASFVDLHKVDEDLIIQHYKFIDESNAKFNEQSAYNRLERESLEQKERHIKERLELSELVNREQIKKNKALDLVLQAKKDVESFILRENLDAAIDAVLNDRSTFRFAIDVRGNKYEEQMDGSVKVIEYKSGKLVADLKPPISTSVATTSQSDPKSEDTGDAINNFDSKSR